ncbi:MAG TPA: molybdopterin-dependent oxidoreductase, partial [Clostridia bacterium]|nr:molybdopterin-dependent oxidoreductase [Clostridia bacterium]
MNCDRLLQGKIPGFETGIEIKKSICTICDPMTQCGLNVYVKDGEIVKVEGSKEHPANEGTLCAKGAATRQYVYSQDRLRTPLKRVGPRGSGKFEPISWDEALDTIAGRLNQIKGEVGPESVVFYSGYSKWYRTFLQRLTHVFGSPNYLTESSTCHNATHMAMRLNGTPGTPDFMNSQCLLVWSANPFHSRTCISRQILTAKEKGLKIITVDPRYTPMVAHSDLHLPVKPGTDGALALSMANVIINEGLYDEDFVKKHTFGFEEYREYVQQFAPDRGGKLTGVPADKIRAAAYLYAISKPSSIMPSASPVVHHTNGVQNYRAIFALMALTGNYDIYGGNIADPPSFLYMAGGFKSRYEEFVHPHRWEEMAPRIGQDRFPVWAELVDEGQAMHLPVQIESQKPYPIKAMLSFGLNYRMWPDNAAFLESLQKLDFIANVDIFM